MPPNFTGRYEERRILTKWLYEDSDHPLLVLRSLGGFGKSALTWHWITHDLDACDWPRLVWWDFYDERTFEFFLEETLDYLGVDTEQLSFRKQVNALLDELCQPGTLLVLDSFERILRAYGGMRATYQDDDFVDFTFSSGKDKNEERVRDCISPHAETFLRRLTTLPRIRGKVLLTTRLCPRILETRFGELMTGCLEKELNQMNPVDAVEFMRAQGVRGSRAEIELACQPYGYHPLSLRLMASLITRNLKNPGDIAVARDLDINGDLVQRRTHILERAYNALLPAERNLLNFLACFRDATTYNALKSITETDDNFNLDKQLHNLLIRGLLHREELTSDKVIFDLPTPTFDLHPIVRCYVYDCLDEEEREQIHERLSNFFKDMRVPSKIVGLKDLNPLIELYYHTVRAGKFEEAIQIFYDYLDDLTYYQFGAYQLQIELLRELFPQGENELPAIKSEAWQAHVLNDLAAAYSLNGQLHNAEILFKRYIEISEKLNHEFNVAIGLGNLANNIQLPIGALQEAKVNLCRGLDLAKKIGWEYTEAVLHLNMGRLFANVGRWDESEQELDIASTMFKNQDQSHWTPVVYIFYAQIFLLLLRDQAQVSKIDTNLYTLDSARYALELVGENAHKDDPVERYFILAQWLLGAAHRVNHNIAQAEKYLGEALSRCRKINMVDHEAYILIDLARLRCDEGKYEEAVYLAEEALIITERSSYVLQGADVHLLLAKLAQKGYTLAEFQDQSDRAVALYHARQARQLAECDGPPDYTYKVAYEEAGRMIESLDI
jgi:hypothetical protein